MVLGGGICINGVIVYRCTLSFWRISQNAILKGHRSNPLGTSEYVSQVDCGQGGKRTRALPQLGITSRLAFLANRGPAWTCVFRNLSTIYAGGMRSYRYLTLP